MRFKHSTLPFVTALVAALAMVAPSFGCDGGVQAQIVRAPTYSVCAPVVQEQVVQQQIVQAAPVYQVQQQAVYASPVVVRQQAVYAPAQQVVVRQQAVYSAPASVVSLNVGKQRRGLSVFRGRSRSVGVAQQAVDGGGGVNINASGRARVRVR
jgi:hypothetical protein